MRTNFVSVCYVRPPTNLYKNVMARLIEQAPQLLAHFVFSPCMECKRYIII